MEIDLRRAHARRREDFLNSLDTSKRSFLRRVQKAGKAGGRRRKNNGSGRGRGRGKDSTKKQPTDADSSWLVKVMAVLILGTRLDKVSFSIFFPLKKKCLASSIEFFFRASSIE